jgi:hypothetical protein
MEFAMSRSKIVSAAASLALLAGCGALSMVTAACSEGPPPPMEPDWQPPDPDVIPINGDSSDPDAPAPDNPDVIPINGDSSNPMTPAPNNPDIIPINGDSSIPPPPEPAAPASQAAIAATSSSTASLPAAGVEILAAHNAERASVGAPPLKWNPLLAAHAADYARQLAQSGQLTHAPREGRGIERENLSEGNPGWTTIQMVNSWLSEKRFFHAGVFPQVCDGDWSKCAHYSQMIWPTTTDIGCGEASGSGHTWLVCRYSPGGNKDGKPVGSAPR